MPRTITKLVYQFDELNDKAKEKAREWWRRCDDGDNSFAEATIDDAIRMGNMLGIEFATHTVKLMGGGTRYDANIWWSLGYVQGDGATFDGTYTFKAEAAEAIRKEAPEDKTLHSIADQLANAGEATATVKSGHHNHGMEIDVDQYDDDKPVTDANADNVKQALRNFAQWIYWQIRNEHTYQNADEQVDESIRINEYEFNADGTRAD